MGRSQVGILAMRYAFIISMLSPCLLYAQDEPSEADVAKLRETIGKIVDIKAQTSEVKSDWAEQKDSMSALLDIQRRELELLNEELEMSGQSASGFDEQKNELNADLEKLKAARSQASEAVKTYLPRTLALTDAFPEPLAEEVKSEVLVLQSWDSSGEVRDALQSMLAIFGKAEQFNRRVTRSREERDNREVEVIYLGLARAYYADRSGNAGVGTPAKGGWAWSSRPEIHDEVVKALDELDRKRPPELVNLPVQIIEVK